MTGAPLPDGADAVIKIRVLDHDDGVRAVWEGSTGHDAGGLPALKPDVRFEPGGDIGDNWKSARIGRGCFSQIGRDDRKSIYR